MVSIEEFKALNKTANRPMTTTEEIVMFQDPETFTVLLTFAQFYESAREMSMYNILAPPISSCMLTGLRIFHQAIAGLPLYEISSYGMLGTMSTVIPQRSIPFTASDWMDVLREIGWEDGDLAAFIETLGVSDWEDD